MLVKILLPFLYLLSLQDVPYKPSEEFELKLNFTFRPKPTSAGHTVTFNETEQRAKPDVGLLPFLSLELVLVESPDEEERVKLLANKSQVMLNRKLPIRERVNIELGFTDDIKDRVRPHRYSFLFLNREKQTSSRIEVYFEEDGSYFVNGQKRGKI